MTHTDNHTRLIEDLVGLVHTRHSIDSLNLKLTEICGEPISVNDITESKDDCDATDWNLLFSIDNEKLCGYFDIYYLKLRKPGFDGATMYITEVSWSFE